MLGGEAAERSWPDVKRPERSEREFRTEGVVDIRLPTFQGGAGLLQRTRSFESGYYLLELAAKTSSFDTSSKG